MADAADVKAVERLLGRRPQSDFEVVVRDASGGPRVIRNDPFLDDGTPMPTRYWLVSERDRLLVSRLESSGAIGVAEGELDPAEIQAAHDRYAQERDAAIDPNHTGPRPSGGVGGTRRGLKCLHAHYAWFLAGGDDPAGRWTAAHLDVGLVAAIDCGSNSTRMLIARPDSDAGLVEVERLTTITRLGEGVDATGQLADDALGRVVECLMHYREVLDRHEVTSVRITATSAARDARNRDHFFDLAEAVVGVRPELLTGAEEAELSFRGATNKLDPRDGPFLVVDIGGGSTEFAYGLDTCMKSHSAQLGCVRLGEQYIEHDPVLPEELVACLSIVELHLEDVVYDIPEAPGAATLIGLAGTVTAAAAIEQGLATYQRDRIHHFDLTKAAVEDVFRTLATETREERLENPGMEEGRVDVIVAGLCILVRTMRQFDFENCLVSEADILDGLLLSVAD